MSRTSSRLTRVNPGGRAAQAGSDDRQFIGSLARGLSLLCCFTPDELCLGNQALASRTGLSRASVTRITYTLSLLGYLEYVPDSSAYRLAPRVLTIAHPLLVASELRNSARPALEQLARKHQCSASLSMRSGLEMVSVDSVHCESAGTGFQIGHRCSIWESAAGLAYIAACSRSERHRIEGQLEAVVGPEAEAREWMRGEIDRYAMTGYCASRNSGTHGQMLGSAIRGSGSDVLVISLSLPEAQGVDNEMGLHVASIAREIEVEMGLRKYLGTTRASSRFARNWTNLEVFGRG